MASSGHLVVRVAGRQWFLVGIRLLELLELGDGDFRLRVWKGVLVDS